MTFERTTSGVASAFVDESIHADAGAIVTAIVVAMRPLDEAIGEALVAHGLVPGIDEYKSSAVKAGNAAGQSLRTRMRSILSDAGCRVAIAVNPLSERKLLAASAVTLLETILGEGRIDCGLAVWFDDGLMTRDARNLLRSAPRDVRIRLETDSDFRKVFGLQMADLCAHTAAMMLRSRMGLSKKEYPAPEGSGYGPDDRMELGFEMWAGLRHNLASGERLRAEGDDQLALATLKPFGLSIAQGCAPAVKEAAERAFGSVYVGCIH